MSETISLVELNRLAELIKKQCVVGFFNFAGSEDAEIFPWVNHLCQVLLDNALNNTARYLAWDDKKRSGSNMSEPSDVVVEHCFNHEWWVGDNPVDDAITSAYFSFWAFGKGASDYYKEDKYLISNKRVSLGNWKKGANPYAELQKISYHYKQEDVCNKDVFYILQQIAILLKKNLSPKDVAKEVKSILSGWSIPSESTFL